MKSPGPAAVEQPVGMGLEEARRGRGVRGCVEREQPRQHALDVAVHDRVRPVEGDAQHGGGDVVADPRQRPELLPAVGHAAAGGRDPGGRAVQVARARVVAQPFPALEDRPLVGGGQAPQRGETAQETTVVGQRRLDLGLLQHDLGDPDAVGVARLAATASRAGGPGTRRSAAAAGGRSQPRSWGLPAMRAIRSSTFVTDSLQDAPTQMWAAVRPWTTSSPSV